MVVKGKLKINGIEVENRDAVAINNLKEISIEALTQDAEILLMDIPMNLN